jgi:hypothetical protein
MLSLGLCTVNETVELCAVSPLCHTSVSMLPRQPERGRSVLEIQAISFCSYQVMLKGQIGK